MTSEVVEIVLFVGIALTLFALFMAVRDLFLRSATLIERRLENGRHAPPPLPLDAGAAAGDGESTGWFARMVNEAGTIFTPPAAFQFAAAVGLLLGGGLFLWRDDPYLGAAGVVIGMLLVVGFFSFRRARRLLEMRNQLPEVVEFLAHAVRAGESLDQAMTTVGQTARGPVAVELRHCANQLSMGLSFESAMQTLTRRAPLTEMRIFAAALLVQRRAGGNLPTTLERLAAVFRDRLSYQRHFRAATAAVRTGALVIVSVGAAVIAYTVLLQPEYMRPLLENPVGRLMLAAAVFLQVIGITWALWLLRSEY